MVFRTLGLPWPAGPPGSLQVEVVVARLGGGEGFKHGPVTPRVRQPWEKDRGRARDREKGVRERERLVTRSIT